MKKILQMSVLTFFALHSVALNCSSWKTTAKKTAAVISGVAGLGLAASYPIYLSAKEKVCNANCQSLHHAFDIAIDHHIQSEHPVSVTFNIMQPWHNNDLRTCREKYESQHPGVFQKTPAIILGNEESVRVTIISREQADKMKQESDRNDSSRI